MEWAYLPDDLLREIARKFVLISDFVRFRGVCKSWRSAVQPADLPPQQPWVMLYDKSHKGDIENCCFYRINANTVDVFHLPEFQGKRFCGASSDGWLVLVDKNRGDAEALSLLQPLTRSHISLPLLENGMPVSQAHLSCSPTSGRCSTVVAWNSVELYSCKLGPDGRWSQWTIIPTETRAVRSVLVSRDHQNIYAMNLIQISHFNLKNKTSRVIRLPYMAQHFLIEASSGELLLVVDNSDGPWISTTLEFYRLEDEGWVKLEGRSIDNDRVFYLSPCQSFSSDVGQVDHFYVASGNLIKIYSLKEDGRYNIQHIPRYTAGNQSQRLRHNTWFFPSLCP